MQEQRISVSIQEWTSLHKQLKRLKQENQRLRGKVYRDFSPLLNKNKSLDLVNQKYYVGDQEIDQKRMFAKQMRQWSKRMTRKNFVLKITPLQIKRVDNNLQKQNEIPFTETSTFFKLQKIQEDKVQEVKQVKDLKENDDGLKIIESICLYGPMEADIVEAMRQGRTGTKNRLLYSSNIQAQRQCETFADQFYNEDGVSFRKLKESELAAYTDQTIFRKNTKRLDCSLLLFRPLQDDNKAQIKNDVMDKVNAVKLMGMFFIQFNDFTCVQYEDFNEEGNSPNKSMGETGLKQTLSQIHEMQGSDRQTGSKKMTKSFIKTKYCLCILTYFPLINLMEQLTTSIMDEIKLRRVQKYAKQSQSQKVSMNYFKQQLQKIGGQLKKQINEISLVIGSQASISLSHFKIVFNFMQNKLDDLVFGGWVFEILKIFDRDVLYDIYVNIMTQESICFVSENLKLLTYVLFFFVSVLPTPFSYPHPCISRAQRCEWLQSPFVITIGLNESSKWVQENALSYDKKIFVDLNGPQVKIRGKKKLKSIKSQKLKKIFHNFYKKLEGSSPVPQIFKKRQTVIRPAAREQNQLTYSMLKNIQLFYSEQIFVHLPNRQIIDYIRQKSPQTNQHSKSTSLLKQVQKYIKQSRRTKERDYFVEELIQQQIFYVYIAKMYQL